jgi:hypothetical protein
LSWHPKSKCIDPWFQRSSFTDKYGKCFMQRGQFVVTTEMSLDFLELPGI